MMLIEDRETTERTEIDQGETDETGMIEEEEIEGTEGVDPDQGTEVTETGEKTDTDRVETDPGLDLLTEEDEGMMMMIEVDDFVVIALLFCFYCFLRLDCEQVSQVHIKRNALNFIMNFLLSLVIQE